jgi:hypothetical protein
VRILPALLACSCLTLGLISATGTASAITVELAKKCRQLAIGAHPPARAGSKTGTGAAERAFYRSCIDNGGSPPNTEPKADGGASGQQTGGGGPPSSSSQK